MAKPASLEGETGMLFLKRFSMALDMPFKDSRSRSQLFDGTDSRINESPTFHNLLLL